MTKDFTPQEALSGWTALQKRMAFEEEVSSTPIGHQSFELRQRAHALRERGDMKSAIALYEQAANLFDKGDPSPAAAMAWFDLGRAYEHRDDGVHKDNLRNAEVMYRRALDSPSLPRDPHRMGMVRDALASCLRYLAYENPAAEKRLLDEATKLFEEAVRIALTTGSAGFEDVVSFSHNLGNCRAQRGEFDAALFAMDRAEAYARRLGRFVKPGAQEEYISRILVHAAGHRARRGRGGDEEQAKKQLREAIEIGHPQWVDTAMLRLARVLLEEAPPAIEEAQALLRRIRVDRIRAELQPEFAHLLASAGLRKEALELHQRRIQSAMEQWKGAMADHIADHHAAMAQTAAHSAARLHLEEEDALEAFFTLEYVSGLRFTENVEAFTRLQENPLLRVLGGYYHARSVLAVELEDAASRLTQGFLDIREALEKTKEILPVVDTGEVPRQMAEELVGILEETVKHPDPAGYLQRKAREVGREAVRIRERMDELDSTSVRPKDKSWLLRLTREVVRDLLREHPDHAFVRLSLAEDLLVVSVWLEGDEVVTRHHRVDVPRNLFRRIFEHRKDAKHPPLKRLEKITSDLEALDLSPGLPPRRMAHGVLLTSYMASFLPLGALGPRGKTPLDHFEALSWMPCLTPLFVRQAALAPREGVVSIAPGGTLHHAFAFGVPLPNETRIEGPRATEERVRAAARKADVVCLYTHGRHASERGPHVDLHGSEFLGEGSLPEGWAGMERVELWACQSGVNMPSDPLVPPVDEAFGLDVAFVRNGVRSAIGTLWSVPDFVTACIVRRYRDGLRQGLPAPRALADAQRFWRDEGARSLLEHLTTAPTFDAGLRAFKATLGAPEAEEEHDAEIAAFLGPSAAPTEDPRRRIEEQVRRLAHPLSWAGFRFVGVHERRPTELYNPEHFRPITPEEMAEGERIVAEVLAARGKEREGKPLDEWIEEWLAEATKLAPSAPPSPEQAIRVARLYRDRLVASPRHNLLTALAWLHEAMAVLEGTSEEMGQREAKQKLALEAAWLWIEVARGDAVFPLDLPLMGAHPVALARAERLLQGLPEDDHVRMARAFIDLLKASNAREDDLVAVFERTWAITASVIQAMALESYETLRTLTIAWEIPLFVPRLLPEARKLCAQKIAEVLDNPTRSAECIGARARLRSTMALVVVEEMPDILKEVDGMGSLTPRELAREALHSGMLSDAALSHEKPMQDRRFNRAWDAIEGSLWGYPEDDRSPIWASTGTLDGAYRRLASSLLVGIASAPPGARDASQFIACLQPLCDLRLPLLRRWVWLMQPWRDQRSLRFWVMARERETVLTCLEESALMVDPDKASEEPPELQPHRLDPFHDTARDLATKGRSTPDLIPWQLSEACGWLPLPALQGARTAAFQAVRSNQVRTEEMLAVWRALTEVAARAPRNRDEPGPDVLFDPGLRLPARQDLLRRVPPASLVLGLAVEASGHLVAASIWNNGDGVEERVHLTESKVGFLVQDLLVRLHAGSLSEEPLQCISAEGRAEAWDKLEGLLAPVLERLLGPALEKEPMLVYVLAPGSLRTLPLLGMRVGGEPLFKRVRALVHLPTLNFEPPAAKEGTLEACWLPVERERGDTSCGEAVVETLRRWFAPVTIYPPTTPTRDIHEVEQLDPMGPALRTLRISATSHPFTATDGTASFNLEGGRAYRVRNTHGLMLPSCEEVELWAATAGIGPVDAIRRNDRDHLPGLVGDFLACGAAAVLDLAWPIFDLVKALVCERFGVLRRLSELSGPGALAEAVASAADLLAQWRAAASSFADVEIALEFLDEQRRRFARDAGLDPRAVVPLAARLDAPSLRGLSVEALVEEACSPVHLAAFRYWSWL
ncbi:CHAT domain-containing protein [Polyangium fumosum]|uniref:CHAT domain-containing protein n=1 Tax=Polyangium fumosum TaxID=889272 RepID=UPI001478957F|nr:CHAT domain-containing protein [Polyangium fumosum]